MSPIVCWPLAVNSHQLSQYCDMAVINAVAEVNAREIVSGRGQTAGALKCHGKPDVVAGHSVVGV